MVICLERGADLHTAQLMPLPLTVFCFSNIQIGFTSLVPAHLGGPRKRAVKRVCVYIYLCLQCYVSTVLHRCSRHGVAVSLTSLPLWCQHYICDSRCYDFNSIVDYSAWSLILILDGFSRPRHCSSSVHHIHILLLCACVKINEAVCGRILFWNLMHHGQTGCG